MSPRARLSLAVVVVLASLGSAACEDPDRLPVDTGPTASDAGAVPADVGFPSDSGVVGPDASSFDADADADAASPADGGRDAGASASCRTAADCAPPSDRCLSASTGDDCAGQSDCSCIRSCVPFASPTCPSGFDCRLLVAIGEGACLPADDGLRTQEVACRVEVDAMGSVVRDPCSFTSNFFCDGASSTQPAGFCASLCDSATGEPCSRLGNFVCEDLRIAAVPGLGICRRSPPGHADYGRPCTEPSDCQGGVCSATFGRTCSAPCSRPQRCAEGATCLDLRSFGESEQCHLSCAPGAQGDAFCAGRNPALRCLELVPGSAVCFPR